MLRISDRDHLSRTTKMIYRAARRRRVAFFHRMEADEDGPVRVRRQWTTKPTTWKQARALAMSGAKDNAGCDIRR